jgi:serine/threonine protein kinase
VARQLDLQNDPLIDSLRQAVRTGSDSAPHPAPDLPETVSGEGAGAAPSSNTLPAGLAIESYSIVEELGRGGMSIAFKAWQVHPRRLVVLKMVLAGAHAGAERRARFLAEADALARLSHPNILSTSCGPRRTPYGSSGTSWPAWCTIPICSPACPNQLARSSSKGTPSPRLLTNWPIDSAPRG